ncbi:MAG: hypothetical protein GX329_06510 [Tissierellia bacterium]|nr:hypothetical protein [Tissierellia bacterium]
MKRNRVNKYMVLGLLIISIKYLINIPNALACFSTGMGIVLLIFGLYAMNHDITKLKDWKKNLVKRYLN